MFAGELVEARTRFCFKISLFFVQKVDLQREGREDGDRKIFKMLIHSPNGAEPMQSQKLGPFPE